MPPKRASAPRKVAASSSGARKRANEDPPEGVGSNQGKNSSRVKRQKKVYEESEDSDSDDFEDYEDADDDDTDTDPRNGLNQSLPPISNVYAAFQDIARRSEELLGGDDQIDLRVATLCSGTESPIFALKMLQESFDRLQPDRQFFKFSHVFSAEIEPFKQAYIARNTEGAIIFNNVLDFIDPKDLKAPTAMGAMEEIPGDIDILVAGCSCVDFSSLNTQKHTEYSDNVVEIGSDLIKDIECLCGGQAYNESMFDVVNEGFIQLLENINQMGTSGQTFFSMLKYVKDYRPKIVILENVMGAPWKQTSELWFPFIGYKAVFVKGDAKDYYIPQTRFRNYLLAVDKELFGDEAADEVTNLWYDLMKSLVRRASTPVNSWLLPPTHPLTERARQDDSEKALNPTYDAEWERSKARAILVRQKEALGDSHPLTDWSLTRLGQPYDRMDRLMILTQSKRVLDCIDINHLRALKAGYDSRFKNRIHDLSQNIDRTNINTPFGVTGCITPAGIHWVTDQCRILSGYEMLGLQGLPLHRLQFGTEIQQELRDLAGNAMTTTVVGSALVAALRAIRGSSLDSKLRALPDLNTTTVKPFETLSLAEFVKRCRKYCFCNRSAKYSTDDFLECTTCSIIRCKWCARNPPHSFRPIKRPSSFLLLVEVEQEVMQFLPSTLVDLVSAEFQTDLSPKSTIIGHASIMNHLKSTTFYFKSTHVTEVSAYGEEFRKQFSLDHVRLEHPVAKATIKEGALNILPKPDAWKFWCFQREPLRVEINKTDSILQVVKIHVDSPSLVEMGLPGDLDAACGNFYHKPGCEAPEDSLHALDGKRLFLFKESARTRTPEHDCYIISGECRMLETYEYRQVLLRFKAGMDLQKLKLGTRTLDARVDGFWVSPQIISHDLPSATANHKHLEIFKVPDSKHFALCNEDLDQQVLAEALFTRDRHCDNYGIIRKYEHVTHTTGQWVTVGKVDTPLFYEFVSYINVKLASLECLEVNFEMADIDSWVEELRDWRSKTDVRDSPFGQLPRAQWLKVDKEQGLKWVQHRNSDAMAALESHIKNQVPPFEVRVKVHPSLPEGLRLEHISGPVYEGQFVTLVQYLVNPKVLVYQAAAYLPPTTNADAKVTAYVQFERNAILHENMQVRSDGSAKHSFVPFRKSLKTLEGFQPPQVISDQIRTRMGTFKERLSRFQSRSLSWTLWRELHEPEFTEREIEEEGVPDLKLRLVGRVERKAFHHGGILADHVGYGKTVVMLSLMHCQEAFDKKQSMQLRDAQNPHRIHLKATLVLVPSHLVSQWAKEAKRFLPITTKEVVVIRKLGDLVDYQDLSTLKRLQNARLIIMNLDCLSDILYYKNLAKLAGSLDPPTHEIKENQPHIKGNQYQRRPFEEWYADSAPAAGDHGGKLLKIGLAGWSSELLEELHREIEGRREAVKNVYREFSENYQHSVTTDMVAKQPGSAKKGRGSSKNFKHSVKSSTIPEEPSASDTFPSSSKLTPTAKSKSTSKSASKSTVDSTVDSTADSKDKKKICLPDKFRHALEAFTFARIVYDEFSYEGFFSTLVISNLQARSKWILSATPPTKDLAAICYTAKHLNVHVARPIRCRQGMPRITNGPVLEDRSNAEEMRIPNFVSDQTIRERHQQGMEFLEHFATSNPLDQDLSGGVEVEEKVVVCEMGQYEFILYHDIEQDLRAHNFDANLLSRESRYLLHPLIDGEWGADGKQVSTAALIHRSSHGNWLRSDYSTELLMAQRTATKLTSLRIFKSVAEKAIWLSKRIWGEENEVKYVNGRNATTDIYILLKDIWGRNLASCGGYDAWKQLSGEIITKQGRGFDQIFEDVTKDHPGFLLNEENFFNALSTLTSKTWIDFYELTDEDLDSITEQEADALREDLVRAREDKAMDLRNGGGWSILQEIATGDQVQYRQPKEKMSGQVVAVTPEQLKDKVSKGYLQGLCRALGIAFKTGDSVATLKGRLDAASKGELDESDFVDCMKCSAMKQQRFPLFNKTTKIRGGKYTFTGNDVSNSAIELRKAFGNAVNAINQERITKNLKSTNEELKCDRCEETVPRETLHMVCECGHLLCKKHLDSDYCGEEDGKFCPSSLKGPTMSLEKINIPQRRLDLGAATNEIALFPKISSKFQMLVNTVRSIPDDEYGLVFFQYPSQLEELQYVLRKNGIGFVYVAPTTKALSNSDERRGSEFASINNLGSKGVSELRVLCEERGIKWSEEEEAADLSKRLQYWINKFGKTVKHPKLRLLQIDDVSSAGSNFQYANHVMFVAPFVVGLQEKYDACMLQAKGRCVRYGQKKKVQVYHFVTANTIEVDILELRTQSHILVRPGKAIGRLQPAPVAEMKMKEYDDAACVDEDTVMFDATEGSKPDNGDPDIQMQDAPEATPDDPDKEERVTSNLSSEDVWKAMNELDWLTTMGIEY
ncbi:uncharacterized protein F4812DRAFT_463192 [Daldinia caldariorum]|uniref:uncharacterized protein n=1 Tax=Daldinia caldariorum TaxID=326644 RepID=UPI0020076330|nr:uncharacterized protein F4812DRAFT_463192 [Daldinia caldariorum]KAI1463863.1 hypothetical protein F4812DRAFT_463192 [Daldinia caldariorum]